MRKIISKIAGTLLGLSLALGVGAAVSLKKAEKVSATLSEFTLASADSTTVDGVTVSFAKASGSTAPTWYAAGLRLYAKNTITISASDVISQVIFNWQKQGTKDFAGCTADSGSYSHPSNTGVGTWTGSSSSITFTLGGSGQLQLNTFSVTHAAGSITPSLDAPELSVNGFVVSWDAIENNQGYSYSVKYKNSEVKSETVNTNSLDISSLNLDEHKYYVSVCALGDGSNYLDSIYSDEVSVDYYTSAEVLPEGEQTPIVLSTTGGTNAYTFTANGKAGLKAGKSAEAGALVVTVPAGSVALTLRLAGWNGEEVVVGVSAPGVTLSESSLSLTSDAHLTGSESNINLIDSDRVYLYTLTFDGLGSDTDFTFAATSGKRFVLWDAVAYASSAPVPTTYSVTYNANAGSDLVSGMPSPATITGIEPGTLHSISSASPTREGYSFKGWSTTSGEDNIDDKVTGSITVNSNVNLYAIWAVSGVVDSGVYKYFHTDDITTGVYVIAAKVDNTYYALGNSYSSKIEGTEITVNDNTITGDVSGFKLSVTKTNDGITIYNGSKYLTYSSSTDLGNNTNPYYWSVAAGIKGTTRCASVNTSSRALVFRAGSTNKFGGYSTSNVTASGEEYYDLEFFRAYTASDYAKVFLENTICSGTAAPTYGEGYSWSTLGTEYTNKLTTEEKAVLVEADPVIDGNIVEQAIARYVLIVRKYGYDNFMGHTIPAGAPAVQTVANPTNASTIIIVVVALTSITSIGVLLVIKRKRSLVK